MRKIIVTSWMILTVILFAGCNSMPAMDHSEHQQHQMSNHQEKTDSNVQTNWKIPATVKPNVPTSVNIQINDTSGKPISNFDINHEKKMHLIVVSKDLSIFQHVHPNYKGKGLFQVQVTFPTAGKYQLFADFKPSGQEAMVKQTAVQVTGQAQENQAVVPDKTLTKVVAGKKVALAFDQIPTAKKPMMMTYHLVDAKSNQPITQLQPYLGAIGHVVILNDKAQNYLHVHPMNEQSKGPDAMFHTQFPTSGVYKIWAEFQYQGKVFVVPFVIKVAD